MKKSQLIVVLVAVLSLFLLSGCEDGDGKIVTKEPKRELSDMPPPMIWDASDPDNSRRAIREPDGSFSDPHTGLPAR